MGNKPMQILFRMQGHVERCTLACNNGAGKRIYHVKIYTTHHLDRESMT